MENILTKPTYPIEIVNGIGLNHEQRLYVIQHPGGGFTCWGFENCFQEAKQLAEMMGVAGPSIEIHGTRECYDMNKELLEAYRVHPASKRTWYQIGTPVKVSRILEAARASYSDYGREGTILRLFYGDPETGRDWCEEFDTCPVQAGQFSAHRTGREVVIWQTGACLWSVSESCHRCRLGEW